MFKTKSVVAGVTMNFDSMLAMRVEEAYVWLKVMLKRKEDPSD